MILGAAARHTASLSGLFEIESGERGAEDKAVRGCQ